MPPPPDVGEAQSNPGRPVELFLLVMLVVIAVFEVWALWKRKNTISHRVQRWSKARKLWRWGGVILTAVFAWHVFWGFPWSLSVGSVGHKAPTRIRGILKRIRLLKRGNA